MARKFMLNVTIDPDLVELLTQFSEASGVSRSALVNSILRLAEPSLRFQTIKNLEKNNKRPDNSKSTGDLSQMTLEQWFKEYGEKKHNIYYRTIDWGLDEGEGG